MLAILAPRLDKEAGIIMSRPIDHPAHNERREALAIAHNRVERLGREVLDERHPLEDIAQLAQQRVDKSQQLGLLLWGNGIGHHRLVPLDDGPEVTLIPIAALHGHTSRLDESVGNPAQGRYHDNNRFVTTLYYLFHTRHALDRTYRSASEFQYFHSYTIYWSNLPSSHGEQALPIKKRLTEKKQYHNGQSKQKTKSSPPKG